MNYITNDVFLSSTIYTYKKDAVNSINSEIRKLLDRYFYNRSGEIILQKYLFSEIQVASEYKIISQNSDELMIVKNSDSIDYHVTVHSKGFIYNTSTSKQIAKFFLNTHENIYPDNHAVIYTKESMLFEPQLLIKSTKVIGERELLLEELKDTLFARKKID